jgi:hypothetical protein
MMDTETQITTLQARLFSVALGVGLLLLSQIYDAGSTTRSEPAQRSGINRSSMAEINFSDGAFNKTAR